MRAAMRSLFPLLAVAIATAAPPGATERFSWQKTHARVTAEGDLEWAPQPFVFQAGSSVRYIDYENGNDNNPGTRNRPWKHHPWDAQAEGRAAQARGIHTYVFKRGVVYRGSLVARESGRPGNPIRLTSDPSWGNGEAGIYGSERITGGWKRASAQTAPGIPNPERVWYKDIGAASPPRAVWMVAGGVITRIPIARDPNWKISNPNDVKSEWYEWEKVEPTKELVDGKEEGRLWVTDSAHLTDADENSYTGGLVWTEFTSVMGTPVAAPIDAYDPARHAIRLAGPYRVPNRAPTIYLPVPHCRYFMENLPRFLDAPGEHYFVEKGPLAGRLYVRLPEDRDPNTVAIEVARRQTIIDIRDRRHIHISGLAFRFQNVTGWWDDTRTPASIETDPA